LIPLSVLSIKNRRKKSNSPYDLAFVFGVAVSEVFKSVWEVVDTVNKVSAFDIQFPTSHEKQHELSQGFKNKSDANFDRVVGAVDGVLIWIHKPSKACCMEAGCDAAKFFCGRKLK
jgi:hypothetical protein